MIRRDDPIEPFRRPILTWHGMVRLRCDGSMALGYEEVSSGNA